MNCTRPPKSIFRTRNQLRAGLQRPVAGFSLMELLITVAIAGILITVAIPSFSEMFANNRVKAAATDLVIAMTKARSEAITRNANITVAANTGGWQNGWLIFPSATPSEILDTHGTSHSSVNISATFTGSGDSIIYQSSGRLNPTLTGRAAFAITISGSSAAYRCVTTDLSGRPNIKDSGPCS